MTSDSNCNIIEHLNRDFEKWQEKDNSDLIYLLENNTDENGHVVLVLLLASEHEFKLHIPINYPDGATPFYVEADSLISAWSNSLNEILKEATQPFSLEEVLNNAVDLYTKQKAPKSPSTSEEELSDEEMEAISDDEEEQETIILADDDAFTTEWELKVARKKKRWAQKEAELRESMRLTNDPNSMGAVAATPAMATVKSVFTSSGAAGILTNDLVRIMENERQIGFTAEPIDDNIYHWQVKIFDFDPQSELCQDMSVIEKNFGYNYIELEMMFQIDLYPFYPPLVKVMRPRLQGFMMQRVTNMEMLKLSYWSPTKDMQGVIQEIKAFLQQWARLEVESERNDVQKYPRGAYLEMEHHLLTLALKTELKNSYKVHLNLAASEDDIWELIKDVFTAFEHGCIKGQKRSEQCSQYCFWHFSKVKRKDLNILLLTRFKNVDLIPEEFRSACQSMKTTLQKRKANDEAETESITKCKRSKKKMAEKETQIDSDNKEIKELKQKIVTMSEKLRCTEQSLIEQKHLVKEKDGKIVVLKKQLISVVTKAEEQKVMVANLNKRIIDLEKELEVEIQNRMHAEEAAVRARQNTQITPTSQQKSLEKRKSVPDDLPRVRSAGEKKVSEVVPRVNLRYQMDVDKMAEMKSLPANKNKRPDFHKEYWARGTGYGHHNIPEWDINAYLAAQKEKDNKIESVLHQILEELKLLYSQHAPQLKPRPRDSMIDPEIQDTGQGVDPVYDMYTVLEGSALIPFIEQYLMADSFLEICRHSDVYKVIVDIVKELARQRQFLPLLCALPNQETSIYQLLSQLEQRASIMLRHLNKAGNGSVPKATPPKPSESETSSSFNLFPKCFSRCRSSPSTLSSPSSSESEMAEEKLAREFAVLYNLVKGMLELDGLLSNSTSMSSQSSLESDKNSPKSEEPKTEQQTQISDVQYKQALQPLQYMAASFSLDGTHCHNYASEFKHSQNVTQKQVLRIAQELSSLSTSLPLELSSSIFVRTDDDKITLMKALITGPEGTPYSGGCFIFDIYFPPMYPQTPPHVNLQTTGGGKVRFNPNLYACGKVCLSLLGTWEGQRGEQWNVKTSTLLQVLVSIQSLILVPDPYFNEPGFEQEIGTDSGKKHSDDYNEDVCYNNMKYAMISQLQNPPPEFADVIKSHFYWKKQRILEEVDSWVKKHNNKRLERAAQNLKQELKKLHQPPSTAS